ncbi:MAG TPA: hypothetical protein VF730_04525 [Terracidiphilus sp.]
MQENIDKLLNTPGGFAIFFVSLWCLTCFVISLFSGWLALSRRFRKDSEPLGETRAAGPFFYTVYMRFWGNYNNVIRLVATDDALYVSVLFLFRLGHPPLRIPWSEITFGRTRRFFRSYIVLTLGLQERIPMRIPERMARRLGIFERFPSLTAASLSL